ncbi:sugar phosphorylase [Acidaminobacter sp. JC074]|uniref:alpha-amylase family glycosyl hydrolase n=1 Tax=Acidaminobacter sp. JC074 TaxID=2530199 RepID=UPI001F0D662C|nr:alpha-amylase family glycosyl hydrolase [Acidaminobacter sp. JC074]MCH4888014.1 sugar phosphorylase [Acidaminobacter sp. JC074]
MLLQNELKNKLKKIYGPNADKCFAEVMNLVNKHGRISSHEQRLSEKDMMLITYGDSLLSKESPLKTLDTFLSKHAKDALSAVHLLPFYPYTSDDGFSVVDYTAVHEELGTWGDIKSLSNQYDLMFDAVINHISKSSDWFKGYLNGDEKYKTYFHECDPSLDYSEVTRPRALPLLSPFETNEGTKYLWTTFSEDQIDLNYESIPLFIEIMEILIAYAKKGARYIRLDAIGFMWKKLGTSCIHLEETHELIKVMRMILDEIVPGTILITETNVPHKENISYFGDNDEAHMVYQFPLPPLTLHTFISEDSTKILKWIDGLDRTSSDTSYFNFLASHDGIGMRPVEGILDKDEQALIVDKVGLRGGKINYRTLSDGSKAPYELNISYVDALSDLDENDEIRAKRFLASQAILLSVEGVPGIYIHSLLGSRNYQKGVEESGINRRINREKLQLDKVEESLETDSLRSMIFYKYLDLIKVRKSSSAFSPDAIQEAVFIDNRIFSIKRMNEKTSAQVNVYINISNEAVSLNLSESGLNLMTDERLGGHVSIKPYEIIWLEV